MRKVCGEFRRLDADFIRKKIPSRFLLHARGCDDCRFMITFKLALAEAFLTTNRLLKPGEYKNCPFMKDFYAILMAAIYKSWQISAESLLFGSSFIIILGEPDLSLLAKAYHIYTCRWCSDYYQALHQAMSSAQKRYEEDIKQGKGISPVTEYSAGVLDASRVVETSSYGEPS